MSLSSGVGLVSGLNYNDLISKLIAADARPIQLLQVKQQTFQKRQSALQSINKAILDLQSSIGNLNAESDFDRRMVSVGDSTLINATTTSTATQGTFSLKVLQLATEDRIASQGVATIDTTPIASGSGNFAVKIGDKTLRSYAVTATTTLAQLRDAINNDSSSDVRASIVSDGSATNPYRLVLTAKSSGAENTIKITTNATSLNFTSKVIEAAAAKATNNFDGTVTSSGTYTGTGTKNYVVKITTAGANGAAQFAVSTDGGITFGADNAFTTSGSAQDISGGQGVQIAFASGTKNFAVGDTFTIDAFDPRLQSAADSVVEVDGIQVRRSTNTIDDAISGVTISALKASTTATTLTVKNDNQNVNGLILDFVNKYNGLVDAIKKDASYDSEKKVGGVLFGDAGVNSIRTSLGTIASSAVAGVSGDNSLGAIGIKLGSDGKLTADTSKLQDAIKNKFDALKKIFAEMGTSTSSGINFVASSKATISGTYNVAITRAAEKATVDGAQAVSASGITLQENLTFTSNSKTVSASIAAGTKIADAVTSLNTFFSAQGLILQASEVSGALRIQSSDYGASETFSVVSDQVGNTNTQLGIGTTLISDTGVDVAGTIDGIAAFGKRQLLSGGIGSKVEGLRLSITSASPVTGKITISKGIAQRIGTQIESITDSTSGLIKTKTDSIQKSIDSISDQIDRMNTRLSRQADKLKAQFTSLETRLSSMQSQGNFLLSQLNSLAAR